MEVTREIFEALKREPFFKGKIVSDSMAPVIGVGEEVTVDTLSSELKRFDLVVFYSEKKLVCHYLWSENRFIEPFLLQTRNLKGNKDFPITREDYLGKVVSHRLSWWRKLTCLL